MSATATGGHETGIGARRRGSRLPARLLRLASDERLVEALRGGSEPAFEVVYTRHHRGVLSFCRHMLGSVEEAEDAVQHTFLAAYRDLLRSSKPIRLRPWLYAIARNRCLSVLRARHERPGAESHEPATEHLSHEVERRHDLRELLGDLAGLPHDQRAALVLAELGDMSHDDIGDVLGCPREKVKALVFQARSSLIASRTARETPCEEIRQQLANLRGGSLRRNTLRRHLRDCPGCRDYRDQVIAQRGALALILPVAPTLGLKAAVLGAAGVTAAASGGAGSVVATTVVTLCLAGGGTAAVDIARDDDGTRPVAREPRSARAVPTAAAPSAPEVVGTTKAPAGGVGPPAGVPGKAKARGPKHGHPRPSRGPADRRSPNAHPKPVKAHGPKPHPGRGLNSGGSAPAKAGGPKARGSAPATAGGPKVRESAPAKAREPKSAPVTARGPKPKAKSAPAKAGGTKPAPVPAAPQGRGRPDKPKRG